LCTQDADCPSNHICTRLFLTVDNNLTPNQPADDVRVELSRCSYVPGTHTPCTTDAQCTTAGEHCFPELDTQGAIRHLCSSRPVGTAMMAATCTAPENCGPGLVCVDTWRERRSYCTGECNVDGDCTGGLLCRKFTAFPTAAPVKVCLDADDPRWVP
jgi:hypothetical protein